MSAFLPTLCLSQAGLLVAVLPFCCALIAVRAHSKAKHTAKVDLGQLYIHSSATQTLDRIDLKENLRLRLMSLYLLFCLFLIRFFFFFPSVVSLEVQITPTHGEISLGESKFFMCEGKFRLPTLIDLLYILMTWRKILE